jgi:DNA-binding beta-propeller fold protein YncE
LNAPSSVAIDASGNVWLANSGNNSLTELNSTGAAISVSNGYLGGGLSQPIAIAVNPY